MRPRALHTAVATCAIVVVLMGVLGLAGWILGLGVLTSFVSGLASMKANTAAGFVLMGTALWRARRRRGDGLAAACAALAGAIGGLTLLQYVLGWDLGIDELLVRDRLTEAAAHPGRMSGATASGFVTCASALLLLDHRRAWLPAAGALCGLGTGLVALIGYAYDVGALYSVGLFSSLSLPTALAFLFLGTGLLIARPSGGIAGFALAAGAGPALFRRLVPWAIGLPLVTGLLHVAGERMGLYPSGFGTAVLTLVTIVLLVVVVGWTARSIAAYEARQRLAEERFRVAIEAFPSGVLMVDADGVIVFANAEVERLFGYTREELLGRPVEILVPDRLREAHLRERTGFARSPSARPMGAGRELFGRRKDGSEFPLEIGLNPVPTAQGLLVLGSVTDITERRSLQSQLLHSQRIESIGLLAGGIAHDFNNLLSVILGRGAMVRDALDRGSAARRNAEEVLAASGRAAGLTRQLLAFSRRQVLQPRVVNVNAIVRRMEGMLSRLIDESIVLATVLEDDVPLVRSDPSQLEQVLMNLVVNARDAMPRGGRLTIGTGRVEFDRDYVARHRGARPGPHLVLRVSDNGAGMPTAVRERVFEPFFTTKEAGKGTGLGLAMVLGVVQQSGGRVEVYSEPGHGTTLKIYLPAAEGAVEAPEEEVSGAPTGTEAILVVEDEDALRDLVRECLEALGYRVLAAANGAAARKLCEAHDGPIHLLLTDVIMPGISGPGVAADLLTLRPAMKVLYMSGYTDDLIAAQGIEQGLVQFLEKPFTQTDLARKVRAVLDREQPGAPAPPLPVDDGTDGGRQRET